MPDIAIRKLIIIVEEIFHEGGPPAAEPLRRGAVARRDPQSLRRPLFEDIAALHGRR